MIKYLVKKYIIKIPHYINIIYILNKKIIIFSNLICQKLIKLNVQIVINQLKKLVYISQLSFNHTLKNKQVAYFQKTNKTLIKQYILELSTIFYKKLKLIGIGYRVFNINNFKNQILLFKLGYSHFLYLKIKYNIKIFNLKTIKLILFSKNYQNLTQILAWIRFFKKPEPYKSKGILYDTEKIRLKKIKNFN